MVKRFTQGGRNAIALLPLILFGSWVVPAWAVPERGEQTEHLSLDHLALEHAEDGALSLPLASITSGRRGDAIPGVIQPSCFHDAQQSLNRCVGRWLKLTELLHELVYEEMSFSFPEEDRGQLEAIDQQWSQFRDEHCDVVAQQVLGGSAYPMLWAGCRAAVTNERIAALQFWGEVAIAPDIAFQRLQELDMELQPDPDTDWNEVDAFWREFSRRTHRDHAPRYDVAQALWLEYRDAHCDFEAMQIMAEPYFLWRYESELEGAVYEGMDDHEALRLRCQTRLTVERLVQLENLATEGF